MRGWIAERLGAMGVDVCSASATLRDGVASILTHRPDLAVVDSRLPDGRGVDLCRQVSAAAPTTALVLHTGTISPEEESEAQEAGVARVVLKSIQGDELMAAVAELLTRCRSDDVTRLVGPGTDRP